MKTRYRQLTMERRSTRRYSVKDGVYAAFSSGRLLVGTIDNFCKDGLCFRYLDEMDIGNNDQSGEITLFSYNQGFFLERIKCRVVRDVPSTKEPSFIDISMKAMSVQFQDLDSEKKNGISSFINRFCVREDLPEFVTENQKQDENYEYGQHMKYLRVVNV